jgi:hypothetical protein
VADLFEQEVWLVVRHTRERTTYRMKASKEMQLGQALYYCSYVDSSDPEQNLARPGYGMLVGAYTSIISTEFDNTSCF